MFPISSGWYSTLLNSLSLKFCVDRNPLFNMVQTRLSIIFVLAAAAGAIMALPLPGDDHDFSDLNLNDHDFSGLNAALDGLNKALSQKDYKKLPHDFKLLGPSVPSASHGGQHLPPAQASSTSQVQHPNS
jgi:hypothetical protein